MIAVHEIDLDIPDGFLTTLLGPSGCGKTTILRMIAGLEKPTQGDIFIKGRRINDTPIHKRNLGMIFQNYALFPHKTIFDNVAFGLKYRNITKADIKAKVKQALETVRLPGVEMRMPSQLSGGQVRIELDDGFELKATQSGDWRGGQRVEVVIRAQKFHLTLREQPLTETAENQFQGRIKD